MKNMHDNKFLEELGSRMRGINEEPDQFVWKNLNARLEKDRGKAFWLNLAKKGTFMVGLLIVIVAVERNIYLPAENGPRPQLTTLEKNDAERKSFSAEPIVLPDSTSQSNAGDGDNTLPFRPHAIEMEKQRYSGYIQKDEKDPVFSRARRVPDFPVTIEKFTVPALTIPRKIAVPIENTPQRKSEARKDKKSLIKGLTAYLQVTPVLNYIVIDPLEGDDVEITGIESTGLFSSKRLGYGVEAGLTRNFNDRWSIATGFSYYQQKMDVRYSYKLMGQFVVNENGSEIELIPVDVEESKVISHSMKNIGMDLNLFYAVRKSRLEQKLGGGLTYHHGLSSRATNSSYVNSDSWYLHYNFLYRLEYSLNEKMTCYFQPRYSRPLLTDEKLEEPLKLRTNRAGASFGVTFRF